MLREIEFSSGDSAELFVKICFDNLVKQNGCMTFIVPKKSLYGDAWEDTRVSYWKKYDLRFILDTGKSFDNVLLEASVFGLVKSSPESTVELAFTDDEFKIKRFDRVEFNKIFVKSNTCQIYKVLYPDKIFKQISKLSYETQMVEGKLGLAIGTDFFSDEPTDYKLLKGIDIERYNVRSHRYLKNKEKLKWSAAKEFLKPKVLSQVIVAHIENPTPHLKITACYDKEGIIITNTLMAFELNSAIHPKFWLSYLNSKLLSWYAYNFIYARAIRTMHFYNFYIQQIPIPKISLEKQEQFVRICNYILCKLNKTYSSFFERLIDAMVYELYLEEEVKAADCEVIKHLTNLPEIKEDWCDEKKLHAIEKVYKELSDPKHPVSAAMAKMQEMPEVKLIEGKRAVYDSNRVV